MRKFESSQKDESRFQSADYSKACSKRKLLLLRIKMLGQNGQDFVKPNVTITFNLKFSHRAFIAPSMEPAPLHSVTILGGR